MKIICIFEIFTLLYSTIAIKMIRHSKISKIRNQKRFDNQYIKINELMASLKSDSKSDFLTTLLCFFDKRTTNKIDISYTIHNNTDSVVVEYKCPDDNINRELVYKEKEDKINLIQKDIINRCYTTSRANQANQSDDYRQTPSNFYHNYLEKIMNHFNYQMHDLKQFSSGLKLTDFNLEVRRSIYINSNIEFLFLFQDNTNFFFISQGSFEISIKTNDFKPLNVYVLMKKTDNKEQINIMKNEEIISYDIDQVR